MEQDAIVMVAGRGSLQDSCNHIYCHDIEQLLGILRDHHHHLLPLAGAQQLLLPVGYNCSIPKKYVEWFIALCIVKLCTILQESIVLLGENVTFSSLVLGVAVLFVSYFILMLGQRDIRSVYSQGLTSSTSTQDTVLFHTGQNITSIAMGINYTTILCNMPMNDEKMIKSSLL